MKLLVKVGDNSVLKIIKDETRGKWSAFNIAYGYQLIGYDLENVITILLVHRQDRRTHVLVNHSRCDSENTVITKLVDSLELNDALNQMINEILDID